MAMSDEDRTKVRVARESQAALAEVGHRLERYMAQYGRTTETRRALALLQQAASRLDLAGCSCGDEFLASELADHECLDEEG